MRILIATLALAAAPLAHAQSPALPSSPASTAPTAGAVADDTIRDYDAVVVTGVQPGPGMWKVRKGDHALWILGTVAPVPKKFEWLSRDVEAVIAQADEVLLPPSFTIDADVGFFRSLALVPGMLKARNNPDGKRLQEVVPADLYARWLPLKARYLGNDRGVEKRRPIIAASELYEAAMKKAGLRFDSVVAPVVERASRKRGLKPTPVQVKVMLEDPKAALREFRQTALDDLDCFSKTLDHIEHDIDTMRERGNAWAVGDVEALRALPFTNQYEACIAAFAGSGLAQRLGVGDPGQRMEDAWLAQARKSLDANTLTFATLPMSRLLKDDGPLARLEALGYEIEAP